jgi:hypothetical protein
MPKVRLIKHSAAPQSGSFEIRFPDGRPSRYLYWDDDPSRRSIRVGVVDQAVARSGSLAGQTGKSEPQDWDCRSI